MKPHRCRFFRRGASRAGESPATEDDRTTWRAHANKCAAEISGVDDTFEDGCDKEKEQDELRKQEEVAEDARCCSRSCYDISYGYYSTSAGLRQFRKKFLQL